MGDNGLKRKSFIKSLEVKMMAGQYKKKAAESRRNGLFNKKIFCTFVVVHIFISRTKEKRERPRVDFFLFLLFVEF